MNVASNRHIFEGTRIQTPIPKRTTQHLTPQLNDSSTTKWRGGGGEGVGKSPKIYCLITRKVWPLKQDAASPEGSEFFGCLNKSMMEDQKLLSHFLNMKVFASVNLQCISSDIKYAPYATYWNRNDTFLVGNDCNFDADLNFSLYFENIGMHGKHSTYNSRYI